MNIVKSETMSGFGDVRFADVPGFIGYKVGDDGKTVLSNRIGGIWKVRSLNTDDRGRKFVTLMVGANGARRQLKRIRLSRLILMSFVGPCPNGMECCHGPSGETDDRLSNIRWDTRLENCKDKARHGTNPTGEKNGNSTLTVRTVKAIKRRLAAGEYQELIAARFQISQSAVSQISRGVTWKDVLI